MDTTTSANAQNNSSSSSTKPHVAEETAETVGPTYKFEAVLFSSIDSSLGVPLSLSHPTRPADSKPHHETTRRNAAASPTTRHHHEPSPRNSLHRTSLHRSSSAVFRALPPIRRMPSLQVPSLTDISNPHNLPHPRSLNQISETEATSFKLKLPLTLVHPNSPYVPWDTPVREQILCTEPVSPPELDEDGDLSDPEGRSREEGQRDKKPLSSVWSALKAAPRKVKSKCRLLLGPRVRGGTSLEGAALSSTASSNTLGTRSTGLSAGGAASQEVVSYLPQLSMDLPLSPTASFRSAETHSLAVWLSERQRKFLDKDCESTRLMTIDEYERVGSWIKPGEGLPSFAASRTSYQCSFISDHGDAVSGVLTVYESDGELGGLSPASWSPSEGRTPSPFGHKRVGEEERLSRVVHRASMLSYIAERPLSSANEWAP